MGRDKGEDTGMGKITVETCEIEGLKIITPAVFGDARGYFVETYNIMILRKPELTRYLCRIISRRP